MAERDKRAACEQYEKIIESMESDGQYLRSTISELEEQVLSLPVYYRPNLSRCLCLYIQIAKLSQSLVGNKSHFAKYVEVKTENLMLQVPVSYSLLIGIPSYSLCDSSVQIGVPGRT